MFLYLARGTQFLLELAYSVFELGVLPLKNIGVPQILFYALLISLNPMLVP